MAVNKDLNRLKDSLILNLMNAKNNKAVQGIVAVSDAAQLEKIC